VDRIKNFFKNNQYITKSNISMLVLSLYYLAITIYSTYYHTIGYYYVPEHRIRFLRVLMLFIFAMSFMIISPNRETHKISVFTIVCHTVLAVSTGLFIHRTIISNIKYDTLHTLFLCAIALIATVASAFGIYKSYDTTEKMKNAGDSSLPRKLFHLLPQIVNVVLVLFVIVFFFYSASHCKRITDPVSYATTTSPDKNYKVTTERTKLDSGEYKYKICVYETKKDIKILMGNWVYRGKAIKEFPLDSFSYSSYVWLSETSFVLNDVTYNIIE